MGELSWSEALVLERREVQLQFHVCLADGDVEITESESQS